MLQHMMFSKFLSWEKSFVLQHSLSVSVFRKVTFMIHSIFPPLEGIIFFSSWFPLFTTFRSGVSALCYFTFFSKLFLVLYTCSCTWCFSNFFLIKNLFSHWPLTSWSLLPIRVFDNFSMNLDLHGLKKNFLYFWAGIK